MSRATRGPTLGYDRIAPHYDRLEQLAAGPVMQQARTCWMSALAGRQRVLSIGEGTGRFAAAFTRSFPSATLTCVDASAAMAARARTRLGSRQGPAMPIEWITATMPPWHPATGAFDAIVTCFFLDQFPPAQLAAVVAALANGATPDATWLVVDFALPPRGVRRLRAQAIHALLYRFFRRTAGIAARALPSPDALLQQHGFALAKRREFSCGLITAEVWTRGQARH